MNLLNPRDNRFLSKKAFFAPLRIRNESFYYLDLEWLWAYLIPLWVNIHIITLLVAEPRNATLDSYVSLA